MREGSPKDQAVLRLLAAAQKRKTPKGPQPEAVEYDWKVPSSFTHRQLLIVADCANKSAVKVRAALAESLPDAAEMKASAPQQAYISSLLNTEPGSAGEYGVLARRIGHRVPPRADAGIERGRRLFCPL